MQKSPCSGTELSKLPCKTPPFKTVVYPSSDVSVIWCTAEKILTVATPKNHRITNCMYPQQQRRKTLWENASTYDQHSASYWWHQSASRVVDNKSVWYSSMPVTVTEAYCLIWCCCDSSCSPRHISGEIIFQLDSTAVHTVLEVINFLANHFAKRWRIVQILWKKKQQQICSMTHHTSSIALHYLVIYH